MNHPIVKRGFALLLLLVLVLTALPAAAHAEGGTLFITGYAVQDAKGTPYASFAKGKTLDIVVNVKDTGDGTGTRDPKNLDITKLEDSFTGGTVSVEKTSEENKPLAYAIRFSGVTYKGVGQALKFQIGTAGDSASYQTMEVTITEAIIYEAPQPVPDSPSTPDAAPAPMILISRSEIDKPLEAGQEVELKIHFQNLSTTRLKSPVATFTPTEGLIIAGGATSFVLEDIPAKKTGSVTIKVQAASVIQSPSQSLGVELKFNYFNNISLTQGSATDKVSIPAVARESIPQPTVILTRSPMEKPISASEKRSITLTFQNAGSVKLASPVLSVAASESLVILNDTSTFLLKDIAPGGQESITVQVQATKEISSSSQSLSTELKFSYDNGTAMTQATASDRVNLSANPTTQTAEKPKPDASVPNIVIEEFTYGGQSVAAGSKFPLEFRFVNTGHLPVENVVVTVDGGESFAMDGSSNTFFYPSLPAGGTQNQSIPMQTLPTSKSGAQSVAVSFKYEFVDNEKRTQSTADIKISIPVFQPDRFQINNPTLPETFTVGEEAEVTMAYVNKGKDDIANVEATVVGDGVETPARTQYLGNITAGSSGNIGFALTPMEPGETSLTLKISYENADQQVKTLEFPITLQAQEPAPVDDMPMDDIPMESGHTFPWIWVLLGSAVLVVVVIVVVRKVRKKGQQTDTASWDGWGEDGGEGA